MWLVISRSVVMALSSCASVAGSFCATMRSILCARPATASLKPTRFSAGVRWIKASRTWASPYSILPSAPSSTPAWRPCAMRWSRPWICFSIASMAIDAIEKQIQGLDQRIAQGRQAGVDDGALGKIEYGLAQVRDALIHLTPAENLVGFNDAVAGLAHKIDLIVAQKDPATLAQLESAITTLREMTNHIASNETVHGLAAQVHALGEKVDYMASAGSGGDALNHLEARIAALSDALAERAQSGAAVPPRLEALVESLTDKIEQIQSSRGNGDAFGHLEDRIVKLVEKLDASDSRLGHLEAIERGLADLLIHIENKDAGGLRAQGAPGVDDLKHDIARTQDALEAVHGTLGHVVDRLAMIEKDIRGEARPHSAAESEPPLNQPFGKLAVRMVSDAPAITAPMPATVAPASVL